MKKINDLENLAKKYRKMTLTDKEKILQEEVFKSD